MESLYVLIPLSVVVILLVMGIFGWALFGGQFDDLEKEGTAIFEAEGDASALACREMK